MRMSAYGNGPIHEDHAELAKLYAISLAHSPEAFAKFRSLTPARCAIWERMMVLTGGMAAKDVPPFTAIDFDALAAAEAAVGLAIVVAIFRSRRTVNVDEISLMRH